MFSWSFGCQTPMDPKSCTSLAQEALRHHSGPKASRSVSNSSGPSMWELIETCTGTFSARCSEYVWKLRLSAKFVFTLMKWPGVFNLQNTASDFFSNYMPARSGYRSWRRVKMTSSFSRPKEPLPRTARTGGFTCCPRGKVTRSGPDDRVGPSGHRPLLRHTLGLLNEFRAGSAGGDRPGDDGVDFIRVTVTVEEVSTKASIKPYQT